MKKTIFGIVFTILLLGTVGLSFINSNNSQVLLLDILSTNINQNSNIPNPDSEISMASNSWSEDTKFINLSASHPYHYAAVDSNNNIHVVWNDDKIGNYEIYYACFNGNSWTNYYQVSNSSDISVYSAIAIGPDDKVHIVWMEAVGESSNVYYNSFDGNIWSGVEQITNSSAGEWYPYIEIGIDNRIHVVWPDKRDDPQNEDSEVYYKFFDGTTWSQDYRVTNGSGDSCIYEFEIDQIGNLHIVYTDGRLGSLETLYHISYDGIEWSDEFPVTIQAHRPEAAMAIGSDNIVHIEWYNSSGGSTDLNYRSYDIENDIWSEIELIDIVDWGPYGYAPLYRNIAVGPDNKVHLAYSDAITGDAEIYYKVKDQNGWSERIQLTNATGVSAWPAVVATYNNRIYIIWVDNRDGTYGLYYKYCQLEVPDPILELMNDILQQLTDIDEIIETETQGCVKCILNKLTDKALDNINDAIDAYLNDKILKAKINVYLIKIRLNILSKIIKIADKLGSIDDDVANDLQNRIENVQNDISLLIQMLSELI